MISEAEIAVTGTIISYSRRVEHALNMLGATETGIHAKIDELGARIPAELERKLRFIASVRNRVAHRVDDPKELPDLNEFIAVCRDALNELGSPLQPDEKIEPVPPDEFSVETLRDPGAEFDKLLSLQFGRILKIAVFIPVVQLLYLGTRIWKALHPALGACSAFACVFGSLPLLIEGWRSGNHFVLWSGVILCAFGWGETLYFGFTEGRGRQVKFHRYAIPVWNLWYLAVLIVRRINHMLFWWSFLPLLCTVGGIFVLARHTNYWEWGAGAAAIGYVTTLALYAYEACRKNH